MSDTYTVSPTTQSQFSTTYTAWLNEHTQAVVDYFHQQGITVTSTVWELNQNSLTGVPYFQGMDPSLFIDFFDDGGAKESFTWTQGKATQTRYFYDTFSTPESNHAPTAEAWTVNATETQSEWSDGIHGTVQNTGADLLSVNLLDSSHVHDADGDSLSISNVTVDGSSTLPSYLSMDGDNIVIDQNSRDLDFLKAGETKDLSVSYTIDDGHGGTTTNIVTIHLTGTADQYAHEDTLSQNQTSDGQDFTFNFAFNDDFIAGTIGDGEVAVTARGDYNAAQETVTLASEGTNLGSYFYGTPTGNYDLHQYNLAGGDPQDVGFSHTVAYDGTALESALSDNNVAVTADLSLNTYTNGSHAGEIIPNETVNDLPANDSVQVELSFTYWA